MTRRQRKHACHRLKKKYGDTITIEVQQPCKALWITIEGPNGGWHANVTHANAPVLRMLLAAPARSTRHD